MLLQLLTTGEALELFKSRVTLKQMEGKYTAMVHDLLLTAQSHGNALILFIQDPKLNRQATALLGHWVPTELSPALIKMARLIPTTVGYTKPPLEPTTEQMVETMLEPIKKITDEWAEWKATHPEEFAQMLKDKQQADQQIIEQQDQEHQTQEP
ncbi:MAG: hypothetical protein WC238_04540 [Parcubacteria group bacterium]|jgi:hypothetical protein